MTPSCLPRVSRRLAPLAAVLAVAALTAACSPPQAHPSSVTSAALSPDGARALSGATGEVRLWNMETGALLRRFPLPKDRDERTVAWSVAFSPDGRLGAAGFGCADGSRDGKETGGDPTWERSSARGVLIWDLETGAVVHRLGRHSTTVRGAVFSADGARLLTGGDDGTVCRWDLPSEKADCHLFSFQPNDSDSLTALALSPDGRRAALAYGEVGRAKGVDVVDAQTWKLLASFTQETVVRAVAFSPDGSRLLYGGGSPAERAEGGLVHFKYDDRGEDDAARLGDPATGKILSVLAGHGHWIRSAAFSADGASAATADEEGVIRVWDATAGRELAVLNDRRKGARAWPVKGLALSKDGGTLLAGFGADGYLAPGLLCVWDVRAREETRCFDGSKATGDAGK